MERSCRIWHKTTVCEHPYPAIKRNGSTTTENVLPSRVIPFTILRLFAIYHELHSSNPYFSGITAACWTQAELAYSIAASTIPSLTPFMMRLNTNMGALGLNTVANTGYSSRTNNAGTSDSYGRIRHDGPANLSLVSVDRPCSQIQGRLQTRRQSG